MSKTLSPLAYVLAHLRLPFMRGERREALRAAITASRATYQKRGLLRRQIAEWTAEAQLYEQLMRERLAGLGYMWAARYQYDRGKAAGGARRDKPVTYKVRFERIYTTEEVFYYKLRVREKTLFGSKNALPHTVKVGDLVADDTLTELSFATERQVTALHDNPRRGAWYLVHRLEGIGLLPERVVWHDLLEHYPADMTLLPWVMGVGARRTVQTIYLSKHPHLLVAGPTGTGKSNAINGFILGLMYYTHPDALKLCLIDLKEGVEFEPFVHAAHLYRPIVRKPEEALAALQAMSVEIDRRLKLLRETGAKDLPSYNAIAHEKLPFVITVIDEYAQLVLPVDRKTRNEANSLVVRISALGRAAGIQIVVCTQYPTQEVVDPQIKINLNLKMSFRTQNTTQSMVILADPRAADLPATKGRALYSLGPDVLEVQVGLVTPEDITHVLKVAKGRARGITAVEGKTITLLPDGAARYICKELEGDLDAARLKTAFAQYGVNAAQVAQFLERAPMLDGFTVMQYGRDRRLEPDAPLPDDTEEVTPIDPAVLEPEEPIVAPTYIQPQVGVERFIRACCEIDEAATSTAAELHAAYVPYIGENNAVNLLTFGKQMKALGYQRTRIGNGKSAYRGIRLRGTGIPISESTEPSEPSVEEATVG
jgi:DNA polymerase III delta prime subunit